MCKIFFYLFVVLEYVDFHLTSLKAETINSSTEERELSALRSSSMVMMTIMMTMVMMTMLWRDSAQDAEHAFQLSGCSCTGSHLILLIIFYLYLLFIISLSAHYIYLYLFFIFYLNLLLQGISLHLPYHLLSSFMLSPPTDWD